uniref:O-antigen polymerase n=1 Tax=Rheinheimera sp. TaxID=1869214 RepID=UPI00404859EC
MDLIFIEKFTAIFISFLILLLAWINARIARSWLVSSSIFCIFWFLYTFFPLVFVLSAPIHYEAMVYILVFCISFSASIFLFNWHKAKNIFIHNKVRNKEFLLLDKKLFFIYFLLIQVFVIFSLIIDLLNQGFTLKDVIFDLMPTSAAYIKLRYSGDISDSYVVRLGTVFTYVGVMFGGIVFNLVKNLRTKSIVFFLALVPSVILMVVQGAKGTVFLTIFLFYGANIVLEMYKNNFNLLSFSKIRYIFIIFLVLAPPVVSSFLSRGLYDESFDYIMARLTQYFFSYAFAHLYAFSDWFGFYIGYDSVMTYHEDVGHDFGFYSFMSVFRFFGDDRFIPPGVYDEYFYYKDILKSNIYTFYRGGVKDFGIFGSFLFAFLFGFFANFTYYMILVSKGPYFFISIYVVLIGFYYTSFIISLFIWNSVLLSVFVFFYLFVYLRAVSQRKVCY